MAEVARWAAQSAMSDPEEFAEMVGQLPAGASALSKIIQGVLIHLAYLSAYGLDEGAYAERSRETLPVAERLRRIFEIDRAPLEIARPPAKRSLSTCRDFALMICALLRAGGAPARLRCGFAAYLGAAWEDHWLCEYWDASAALWRLADAQLDDRLCARLQIAFDPSDVPRGSFLTAGEAWADCRTGRREAANFGQSPTFGLWFMHVNVVRDHYALNNRETSSWDGWRAAPGPRRIIAPEDFARLDALADRPESPLTKMTPRWLA